LLFLCIVRLAEKVAFGQGTYTAASCSYADVNAVINGGTHVAVNGDTIIVPHASCASSGSPAIWGTKVQGTDTGLIINVYLTLECDVQGACYIKDNMWDGGVSCTGPIDLIYLHTPSGGEARVTGFNIINQEPTANCGVSLGTISISANSGGTSNHQVRIDNNTINPITITGIQVGNDVWGVADHNTVTWNGTDRPQFVQAENGGSPYGGYYGDVAWSTADAFGTAAAWYIESNTFSYNIPATFPTGCFDEEWGGRVVFRFNTGCPFVGNHGLDTTGRYRGARSWEVYNNTFDSQPNGGAGNYPEAFFIRGGTGFMFNNALVDNWTSGLPPYSNVAIPVTYRVSSGYAPWGPTYAAEQCDGRGPFDGNAGTVYASGTASASYTPGTSTSPSILTVSGTPWTASEWVGYSIADTTKGWGGIITANTANTITSLAPAQPYTESGGVLNAWTSSDSFQVLKTNWCLDQFGRGPGLRIVDSSDTNGQPVLQSTSAVGSDNEVLDPAYAWLNSLDGVTTTSDFNPASPDLVQNSTFYNYQTSGCTGTQTTGVCSGTLASRASNCTTGVGYWATDQGSCNQSGSGGQGELFVCTAGAWGSSPYYLPYTYPHPLVGPGSTPPPTNLVAMPH
jgi:hypothetical protein